MTENNPIAHERAEWIEAVATLLLESMEHGGNLDSQTYGAAAAMIAEYANDIQTMTRSKAADRTA